MRTDTSSRILDVAEQLVQRRGFNAFSFQDVADTLGIRKASLHYHFAGKADLGVALAARYGERGLTALGEPTGDGHRAKLDLFFRPFLSIASQPESQCLIGVLAAEMGSLPEPMRAEVSRFILALETWLARLLEDGRAKGAFSFAGDAAPLAATMFAALEGGLVTARAGNAPERMERVVAVVRQMAIGR
jgi:TetR/AcrR family transcriptional repressor of nem operon